MMEIKKGLKVIGGGVLIGVCVWGFNHIRDTRKANRAMAQALDTLKAQQAEIGTALTTLNRIVENQEALLKKVDREVAEQIRKDGGQVMGLYQATGEVKAVTSNVTQHIEALTATVNGLKTPYLGFTGRQVLQDRQGLPPLADVTLTYGYDPAEPTKGGTLQANWRGYRETFHPSLTTWTTDKGGYRAAFQLYRDVHIPKGSGVEEIRREDINLTQAEATFSPEAFGLAPSVPRWTVSLGAAREMEGLRKTRPAALVDYRFSNRFGLGGGVIGTHIVAVGSYRFGR